MIKYYFRIYIWESGGGDLFLSKTNYELIILTILQERGLFGDVLGGILGGENATASDAATDAAPSDIVNIQHCF